jgi:hypothetical protein
VTASGEASLNPALRAFAARLGDERQFAQVLVRRMEGGYDLRHAADRRAPESALREVPLAELRRLAQFTAEGAFRPLKAAPNLARGWRHRAPDLRALGEALDRIYPGAVADWFAAQSAAPPITDFRTFAARQTGMYRAVALLKDSRVARVIRATCDARFCLKQRLWSVEGLPADPAAAKSLIPCLEPCALLLEFARKAARFEQEDQFALTLAASEVETLRAALQRALDLPDPASREADLARPDNPRRLKWLLETLPALANTPSTE